MTTPILVTGGTGTLGRLVVPRLRAAGHDVRVLSRGRHAGHAGGAGAADIEHVTGDLATGEGVAPAVAGVGTVLHLAGTARGDEVKARHLVRAAEAAGVRHLVFVSVVGADRVPVVSSLDRAMFGYYAAKSAAERVVAGSGLPWTTLRATQFHELLLTMAREMVRLPVVPVPTGFRFQPVAADEVADRLVELALGTPAGLVPDLGGPQVLGMADLLRQYQRARGRYRPVLPVRVPGRAAAAIRAGENLAPDDAVGRRTWADFLADRVGPSSTSTVGAR
ncbi:NAD(P)H-binding protein [Geodermatophilus sp. YIM 151500]|uniref:SDR family oxidoreductase n=1 Tax=Geodermatophilus sp. YIM 151500 TaxID=2984531 RepID=UPI0021E4814E|nr:NAD(P)H-binding protein [Geodermatophilus sp. YIM 151500]MCV2489984.1 NAD(P)H-binding protein [Geodermatophilus sp. YIM 151500]